MDNTENAKQNSHERLMSFIVGCMCGGVLVFLGGAVLYLMDGSSYDYLGSTESFGTYIPAEAAETNPKPSAYEILMKDPAKYCHGRPLGISGAYTSSYLPADLYCVESEKIVRYIYYVSDPDEVDPLRPAKGHKIGKLQGALPDPPPKEIVCHGFDEVLGVNLEITEDEGGGSSQTTYEVWCASETELYNVLYSQPFGQTLYHEFFSDVWADDFTVLHRTGVGFHAL